MKTVLTICILFASILFSSVIARELAQSGTDQTGNHNNPAVTQPGTGEPNDPKSPIIKCDPSSPTYKSCVAQQPKVKCNPKGLYNRCEGTGTSPTGKNHNNPSVNPPAVKPGTGGTGNRNNNPTNPACDPKSSNYASCVSISKPKPKCDPRSAYHHCP
ncbi:uncharacterized protein LOC132181244 isoform X2 [Corylus avellana]|uniref:uncharacterized protein LOC132181244 isoform X2 n=1 Tax=Corylus avellana TaxID=13451 RepID=UPI00286BFB21|nr:uncharacterized protein LOC132181244 isoform X2 [Corylus avellana]